MTPEQFDKFVTAMVEDDTVLSGVEYMLRFLHKYVPAGTSPEVLDATYNEIRRAVELAKARKQSGA